MSNFKAFGVFAIPGIVYTSMMYITTRELLKLDIHEMDTNRPGKRVNFPMMNRFFCIPETLETTSGNKPGQSI